LIGFLAHQGGPTTTIPKLINEARTKPRTVFRRELKRKVRRYVLGDQLKKGEVTAYLETLRYGEDDGKIRAVLLCFNLATLEPETNRTSSVRLSFHHFRNTDWDLEHIRATDERSQVPVKQLKATLKVIGDYWDDPSRKSGTRPKECEKISEVLQGDEEDKLSSLYQSILGEMEGNADGDLGASNGLGNITLLDAGINRGYGNSPFAVKRSWVLGLKHEATYVLPCTRTVFAKGFSPEPINLLNWTRHDAEHYITAVATTLEHYFGDTWEEST
jgi:hypothetical protein